MIDRKRFFDGVRASLFHGILNQGQVDGMGAMLDEWERRKLSDLRWLADMMGTVYRECGPNMVPVREAHWLSEDWRRENLRYYPYYGRGLVQLTWADNYRKQGERLGVDLLGHPDLALEPRIASNIMFEGMIGGQFTGRKLADYFNATTEDWVEARRIINGLDHAEEIAAVSRKFYAALQAATAKEAA
jgi:hypothetical protein